LIQKSEELVGFMENANLSDMQLNQGGTVSFEDIEIKPKETFLDYLFGGCQLGL